MLFPLPYCPTALEIQTLGTQINIAAAGTGSRSQEVAIQGLSARDQAQTCCSQENRTMRHADFAPLYRSTVGFDRLFSLLDTLATPDSAQTYPPYNIERTGENAYRISRLLGLGDFDRSPPQCADRQG
jgi:hypothetical protein